MIPSTLRRSFGVWSTLRRKPLLLGVILLLMLTIVGALWRGVSSETAVRTPREATAPGSSPEGSGPAVSGKTAGRPATGSAGSTVSEESATAPGASDTSSQLIGSFPLPPIGVNIIKTAALALELKKDRLEDAYQNALLIVQSAGGYAVASGTEPGFRGPQVLLLTARVPAKNFESTLSRLRELGKVRGSSINSEDVTAEFVDLNSRLKHWRAQEAVLLGLMAKAKTIEQSIAIQQQLSQIQMEIETITGRLRYLENQTSFSTIQLSLRALPAKAKPADPWGVKAALEAARNGFMGTVRTALIALGYLSPLVALGLLGWLAYGAFSAAARRRTRGSESS